MICFSARGLPGVWYPAGRKHKVIYHQVECFGCNLETCILEGRKCLTSISVEEMTAAVLSVLGETQSMRTDAPTLNVLGT